MQTTIANFSKKIRKNRIKYWQGIKEIINTNKKTPQKMQNINNNGKLIANHKNIANTFNNFFVDIPKQTDSNMVKTDKKYQDYLLNPVVNTFYLDQANRGSVVLYKHP